MMTPLPNTESFVSATLYLTSGELAPSVIAERLGLTPTRMRYKGEFVAVERPELGRDPDNYFILEVRRVVQRTEATFTQDDSATQLLRTAIEELMGMIEPVADKLLQLQVSATLMCAYRAMHAPQWFILPNTLLCRLAALNLSVKVLWTSPDSKPEA
ncbi:MAG: DUF4279 domain-containing protein [Nitrospira sp.]